MVKSKQKKVYNARELRTSLGGQTLVIMDYMIFVFFMSCVLLIFVIVEIVVKEILL